MNTTQTKILLVIGILLIGIVVISGCISNEEKETHETGTVETDYFPLSIGNTWSYDLKIETSETNIQKTVDVKITKKEKVNGIETYVMEYELDNKVLQTEYYTKDNKKVICRRRIQKDIDYTFEPPEVLYDFSKKKGEKWEWSGEISGEYVSLKGEMIGEETITVPAGTFKTHKVKIIIRGSNNRILTSINRWFAQGVGIVKEESIDGSMFVSAELKEYDIKV